MRAALCSSTFSFSNLLLYAKKFNSGSNGARIALLDGGMKVSERMLAAAEKLALDATHEGVAISNNLEMEFLLWLACTAHVKNAIGRAGAKKSGGFALVMVGEGAPSDLAGAMKLLGAKEIGKIPSTLPSDFEEIEKMALGRIN